MVYHFSFITCCSTLNSWIGGFVFWMSRTGSKLTFPSFCHLHSPPMFSMTHLSSALAPGLTSVYWGSSRNICCAQQPGKENQGKRLANKKTLLRQQITFFSATNSILDPKNVRAGLWEFSTIEIEQQWKSYNFINRQLQVILFEIYCAFFTHIYTNYFVSS